ncbi:unnamed protein product [Prorocentrum cordatum]|uniref:Uncharacterized protein n=1 Tax=Prorocentrum cordatum TaxID=2364126 RepID=A0ABN9X138_9DINO|nr:unnamed protein product [Polarella glacialis]
MSLTFVGAASPALAGLQVSQLAPTTAPPALRATAAQEGAAGGGSLGAALPVGAAAALVIAARRPARAARRAAEAPPAPPPFDPATQLGAMAPLGFFDPAGFSKVGDEEGFRNLRTAELKHGRVAMMAALGFVAQQYIQFPGFESVPAGVGAVTTAPGTYGFVALFLFAGAMELAVWTQDPKKEVGNFGDPLGLSNIFGYDEDMRHKELNNGRFAMFAAIGILSAELLTGKVGLSQF